MKFFGQVPGAPKDSDSAETADGELAVSAPEAAEKQLEQESAASAPEPSEDLRSLQQLATFLNCQLTLIGGFWIGAVPAALISFGSAVGGWSGGVVFTMLLATSAQMFLSNHPTFPYNAYLRSYGWEVVRRRDGLRTHFVVLRPSKKELRKIEADEQRGLEILRESGAHRAADRSERRLKSRARKRA